MGYLRPRAVQCHRVPIHAMTKELRQEMKTQLALAIAQGRSVALWARDNQVPRSTAYRWASQPEVRATAESYRRRARDRALSRMVTQARRAYEQNVKLAEGAESESVKLRALRAILAGVIPAPKFSDLRRRMAAIKQELHEQTDDAKPVVPSDPVFTSEPMLQKPEKCATLSHFFAGTRPLFGRRSCSTTDSVIMIYDMKSAFSASQKASWRTCSGKRPAISADVHHLPVSPSATQRVRPRRLTTPRGVPCNQLASRGAYGRRRLADFPPPPPPPPFPPLFFLPPPPPPPSARDRAACTSRSTFVGGKDLLTSEPNKARAVVDDNCTLTVLDVTGGAVPVP